MTNRLEQFVTKPSELAEVCEHLASARRFGFDTEFVGEDSYRPKLCLIQVATEDRLILIDPFEVGPLDSFWKLVVDPANEVIVHAGREEVRLCQIWAGKRPGNVFDLQIAAGLVGLNYPLGHANLVYQLLGVSIAKTETLTEWRDRPLTSQQIRYAYDDVRYLLQLGAELKQRLNDLNRLAWAREEFERLATWAEEEDETPQEKWRKLRGLGSLTRRQLAIVRAVHEWREETAQRLNRPPRTLCRDDLIVEIARRNPTKEKDLLVIRGLARRDSAGILAAVERARDLPPDALPLALPREIDPPEVTMLGGLLSTVVQHLCAELKLAPSLVTSANELRLLVRARLLKEKPRDSLLNTGWRREHIRRVLMDVLDGRLALRIAAEREAAAMELVDLGQQLSTRETDLSGRGS